MALYIVTWKEKTNPFEGGERAALLHRVCCSTEEMAKRFKHMLEKDKKNFEIEIKRA